MNQRQTRFLERLLRVQGFGVAHNDQFPASSPGGKAFKELEATITVLREQAVSKRTAMRDGRKSKQAARAALLEHLVKINGFARVIARDTPGFDDHYRIGRLRSDQAMLTTARTFVKESSLVSAVFARYGLRETALTELAALVDDYERRVRQWQSARASQAKIKANLTRALEGGNAIVARLEPIVNDRFADDPGVLAMWEHDRRVEPPRVAHRRKNGGEGDAPAAPAPTTPAAGESDAERDVAQ